MHLWIRFEAELVRIVLSKFARTVVALIYIPRFKTKDNRSPTKLTGYIPYICYAADIPIGDAYAITHRIASRGSPRDGDLTSELARARALSPFPLDCGFRKCRSSSFILSSWQSTFHDEAPKSFSISPWIAVPSAVRARGVVSLDMRTSSSCI